MALHARRGFVFLILSWTLCITVGFICKYNYTFDGIMINQIEKLNLVFAINVLIRLYFIIEVERQ